MTRRDGDKVAVDEWVAGVADRPPPKIGDHQLEAIERALLQGALAHGFATDVGTLEGIAVVVQGLTGV